MSLSLLHLYLTLYVEHPKLFLYIIPNITLFVFFSNYLVFSLLQNEWIRIKAKICDIMPVIKARN